MKTIYVAKDKDGAIYEYTSEPELRRCQSYYPTGGGVAVKANIFDIELEPLEVVKIHIDIDKGTFVVERTRKDGYYAVFGKNHDVTWVLESKSGVWHYADGTRVGCTTNMKIGKNPIPKECLPC